MARFIRRRFSFDEEQEHGGEVRYIVVGKTGTGKSRTCNSIIGEKVFKSTFSSVSVTKKCQFRTFPYEGKTHLIVDTPGICDTDLSEEETKAEIGKVMGITSPGFHAFVIVLKVGRFTDEENKSIETLAQIFGPELYERSVIVFTRIDELSSPGNSKNCTFEEYLKEDMQPNLKRIISKCSYRCIGFDNNLEGPAMKEQVSKFMKNIDLIIRTNKNTYYKNKTYTSIESYWKVERERRMEIIILKRDNQNLKAELKAAQLRIMQLEMGETHSGPHKPKYIMEQERKVEKEKIKASDLERNMKDSETKINNDMRKEIENESPGFGEDHRSWFKKTFDMCVIS